MKYFVFALTVVLPILSSAQTKQKQPGLTWTCDVAVEKGFADEVKVVVIKMTPAIDTIEKKGLVVKQYENRGDCNLTLANGSSYQVILMQDTAIYEIVQVDIDTRVSSKYMKKNFSLTSYLPINFSVADPDTLVKRFAIRFNEQKGMFEWSEN